MSRVTDSPAGMCPADIGRVRQLGDARVSPDGSVVAFTVTDPDLEGNRYVHRIWLVGARGIGASPRPFTGPGSEQLPRWSPDGRRLAFAATGRRSVSFPSRTEVNGWLCAAPKHRSPSWSGPRTVMRWPPWSGNGLLSNLARPMTFCGLSRTFR